MIIGITGLYVDSEGNKRVAGAGKDTVADLLFIHRHVVTVALADPLKRICQDVYQFSYAQLWGPSQLRSQPDSRYLHSAAGSQGSTGLLCKDPEELNGTVYEKYKHLLDEYGNLPSPPVDKHLTPRYALQQLGTEWARDCYSNTWIDYGIRVAKQLMNTQCSKVYINYLGVINSTDIPASIATEHDIEALEDEIAHYPEDVQHIAFSDVRFFNEVEAIKASGGKVIRVKRTMPGVFDDVFDDSHRSEREVVNAEDDEFDYVIENSSSLEVLQHNTLRMFDVITGRIMAYDESQANIPPFMRKKV